MDETSKKGHNYITVVADLSQRKVIFVTDGKDSTTVRRFAADFEAHRGNTERVDLITCDMSLGFRKGIQESFENSRTIIDKFHVIKHANEAVDKVRKMEAKENVLLKNSKYLWLKNDANLTKKQREKKEPLRTIRNHWDEILHYFEHPYTNAILEGVNSIIQNIKRRARGFRNDEYFKTMIYLGCGKLNLNIQIP